eukprot:TCONS_00007276-protein
MRPRNTTKFRAKIYLHTRATMSSPNVGKDGIRLPDVEPLKHWSIIIHYIDVDADEELPMLSIIDANRDEEGFLLCDIKMKVGQEMETYLEQECESMKLLMSGEGGNVIMVSPSEIKDFSHDWNMNRKPYRCNIIRNNTCQEFVKALARKLGVEIPVRSFKTAGEYSVFGIGALIVGLIGIAFVRR